MHGITEQFKILTTRYDCPTNRLDKANISQVILLVNHHALLDLLFDKSRTSDPSIDYLQLILETHGRVKASSEADLEEYLVGICTRVLDMWELSKHGSNNEYDGVSSKNKDWDEEKYVRAIVDAMKDVALSTKSSVLQKILEIIDLTLPSNQAEVLTIIHAIGVDTSVRR